MYKELTPEAEGMITTYTHLEDNLIQNQTKWPEIFGLSEEQLIAVLNAWLHYEMVKESGSKNTQSYNDWLRMYNGIHRESNQEIEKRSWFACVRWVKQNHEILKLTQQERRDIAEKETTIPEQIDTVPMGFVEWYSGMERVKIKRAYLRWLTEANPGRPIKTHP